MKTILKIFTLIFLFIWFFIPSEVAYGIKPGETKKYWVREGRTDKHRTSKNGLRAFAIWVPDDNTVVEARWYEEVRGGSGRWILRGKQRISGKDKRFSRTVYLRRLENLKLEVTGITSSRGERRKCYYWVHCIDDPYYNVRTYNSRNFKHLNTWFKADNYQRWYWCGCACWVVVNPIDKEIVLFDGYVSKATVGGYRGGYPYGKSERTRVAKFVNLLRYFISQNYRIVGILASHEHGDHVGDIPYILGGIRADSDRDFMKTDIALTGRAYKEKITVVYSQETENEARYGDSRYDKNHYYKPGASDIYSPEFNGSSSIKNKNFAAGRAFNIGNFTVQPYIWDHGSLADGASGARGDRRTLAYRIWRRNGTNRAIVFFTSGFCEDKKFVDKINRTIPCHHIIFAWNEDEYNGESAQKISLLGDSPVGYNYIFTNHTDNNSNTGDIDDGREEVIDMFGMFLERGVVDYYDCVNNKVKWRGQERNIKLGAFYNRLGVD